MLIFLIIFIPIKNGPITQNGLLPALGESIKLAKSLVKFPQNAMIMDKLAAINSQLNPNSEESMRDEAVMTSLLGNAIEDMKEGVKKFQAGLLCVSNVLQKVQNIGRLFNLQHSSSRTFLNKAIFRVFYTSSSFPYTSTQYTIRQAY